jgi:hypothetical protein
MAPELEEPGQEGLLGLVRGQAEDWKFFKAEVFGFKSTHFRVMRPTPSTQDAALRDGEPRVRARDRLRDLRRDPEAGRDRGPHVRACSRA